MTPHGELVARLRAIASANICDLLNMGDESHEPPEITWGELDDIGRAAQEAADALAALPPPADPPHDCEAWRLEGLGCARCNKADPPALVALEREVADLRHALWNIAGTVVAICDDSPREHREIACADTSPLVGQSREYIERFGLSNKTAPLPAAPPVTDTPQGCPTCGGPRPCDRCTTSNAVDLDALKARLENERLRAAAEIVKLIADDSWAVTFQSLGQYRSALLKVWRDSAPAAPPQEDQ